MSNETLFYICGVVLAASAVTFSFIGLKVKGFPGKALPLIVLWFVIFVGGATTFAVLHAQDEEQHKEAEFKEAGEEINAEETGEPKDEAGGEAEAGETEEAPAEEEAEGGEEASSGGDAAAGEAVFAENCAVCHGDTGHGGGGGPDLTTMPLAQTEEGAVQQVTNGGGGMPAFGEQLSEEEIDNVAAYVVHEIVGK